MILLLLACEAPETPRPAAPDDSPPVDAAPEPASPPPAVAAMADVLGDCDARQEIPGEYPNQLARGEDLHRLTLDAADAVCGDGTPAVLFVREATVETGNWVIHLQGGGDCVTFEECEERWCGTGYYDASKMSSAWVPETIRGKGIVRATGSYLDTWNQVYFYYCSSDLWSGQGTADVTSVDGTRTMRVERRGHTILAAAVATLAAGVTSDDGTQLLPPITDAQRVWLTGTSAGSLGAQIHLDWLAAELPDVAVSGAFDAAVRPDPSTVEASVQAVVDGASGVRFAQRLADESAAPYAPPACAAGVAADALWQCNASAYLSYRWIVAPFFAKMDLYDSAAVDDYEAGGATDDEFAASVAASLDVLAGAGHGVFGPACGQHVAFEEDLWFFTAAIRGDSAPITLHDALVASLDGAPVTLIDPMRDLSKCP